MIRHRAASMAAIPSRASTPDRLVPSLSGFPGTPVCSLYLEGDLGVSLNATTASSWADQSGLAHDALQGTAAMQPLFVANGLFGLPTLRADGADDFMQTAAYVDTEPTTLFVVWKTVTLTVSPNNDVLYDGRNLATMYALNRTANYAILNSNGIGLVATAVPAGAFHRSYAEYNGLTAMLQIDNGAQAAGSIGAAAAAPGGFTFGAMANGSRAHNGEYFLVIQHLGLLPASVANRLRNFIRNKTGLD